LAATAAVIPECGCVYIAHAMRLNNLAWAVENLRDAAHKTTPCQRA